MSFRHRPLMTSVYEWHCSHACTLVMGRTLDLPSVIELAPCKYKRVYFYFGVQKKLITYQISTNDIYIYFFVIAQWTLPNIILIRDIDMFSTCVPI